MYDLNLRPPVEWFSAFLRLKLLKCFEIRILEINNGPFCKA